MEKSESSERASRGKAKRNDTTKRERFVIPTIPSYVKFEDFDWDNPVDLEAAIEASKKKSKATKQH